ncbi:MAG: hypothetical protein HOL13_10725 [Phycisphaerae bacterium]|nr:hypothetical protein [Phycisphaerae bacterium]
MPPGTLALPSEPIAWWIGRDEPMLARGLAGCQAVPLDRPLQTWRCFGPDGQAHQDRIRDIDDEGPDAGVPLLLPLIAGGSRLDGPEFSIDWPPSVLSTIEPAPPVHWDVPNELAP